MRKRSRRSVPLLIICALLFISAVVSLTAYAGDSDGVVTASIHYYYYDEDRLDHKGTEPFPAFVANMPQGSAPITQRSPSILGFSPYTIDKVPLNEVTVNFSGNNETDVFYFPTEVSYIIRLNKQDIGGESYTVSDIINGVGVTGAEPVEFGNNFPIVQLDGRTLDQAYEGFTLMYHVPEVIAADGSTEFECYYDRNYYMVSVDLGPGGYGVDPLYVPYGCPLALGTPHRTGYNFVGWDIERADTHETLSALPPVCPAYDISCTARWEVVSAVPYTVVYCNADLDDGDPSTPLTYSHWGAATLSELPDTVLSLDDIIAANKDNITSFDDHEYFTFDAEATAAHNGENVTIKSDGSTIVRLYYSRNKYKLRYIYARYQQDESSGAVRETEPQTGTYYYLQNVRSGKVITPNTASGNSNYLSTVTLVPNTANLWTLEDNGSGGFYLKASNGKYLNLSSTKAWLSNTPVTTAITPFAGTAYPDQQYKWSISQGNYCLNDKGQASLYAGPSTNPNDPGSCYYLIPANAADGTYQIENVNNVRNVGLARRTTNGDLQRFEWNTANSLPSVKSGCTLTQGTVVKRIGNVDYIMPYVELVAEFEANIEDIWPADVLNSVDTYSFGSWSTEEGSGYRSHYSDHANIVGKYPYMSADMIVDPTCVYDPDNVDQVAQNLYAWWGDTGAKIGPHRFKIYYETLDPDDYDIELNGIRYKLDRTQEIVAAHNRDTRIDPFVFVGYTILPEEADGHSQSHTGYPDTGTPPHYKDTDGVWTTDFHYTRNTHSLQYYNYNTYYNPATNSGGDPMPNASAIPFGHSLEGFEPDGVPPYPAGLAPDSYDFAGWYDSDTYDNPFDWTAAMPDSDEVAYAYWKPKEFDVYFYNSESDYLSGDESKRIYLGTGTYGLPLDVHNAEAALQPPEITSSTGTYYAARAGWYYYDDEGTMHAFDPETMTVSFGMHLFMRWSSNVPAYFRVHYYVQNSTTEVAPDTFGYSFVGLTRTFKAKVGSELNDGYTTHYFPDRASTSILMHANEAENEKTFYYMYREYMPYTVKYVALNGPFAGTEILPDKTVNDNIDVVVTEKFVHVQNYIPNAYYISKTLIASSNPDPAAAAAEEAEQNVITFYYHYDTVNMPYHIKYMVEDENGTVTQTIDGQTVRFKEKNFIDGYAERGTTLPVGVNNYPGYDVRCYAVTTCDVYDNSVTGALTDITEGTTSFDVPLDTDASVSSKEIHVYYLKKTYPVKVVYQISSTDNEKIAEFNALIDALDIPGLVREDPVTIGGNTYYRRFYKVVPDRKYNSQYTEVAPEMPGFMLNGNDVRTLIISDDDAQITNNRIVFMYTARNEVMYFYYAVLPRGNTHVFGNPVNPILLSVNQEVVLIGERPNEHCRAFLDNSIYTFVGWYEDEECTVPVENVLYGSEYVLTSTVPGADNVILPLPSSENRSYYAKYDFRRGDLTVSVTDDPAASGEQAFEFVVQGQDPDNSWVNLYVTLDPARGVSSVKIEDLPVGNYTVSQCDWSWRYTTASSQDVTVIEDDTVSVAFAETFEHGKWLDGSGYCENDFGQHTHVNFADATVRPATCETAGEKNVVCADCGAVVQTGVTVPPTGHTYGTWIPGVDASTSVTGTRGHYRCEVCGGSFNADFSPMSDLTAPVRTAPAVTAENGAQVYRIDAEAVYQYGASTPVGVIAHGSDDGFTVVKTNGGTIEDGGVGAYFTIPKSVIASLPYLVIETGSAVPEGTTAGLTVELYCYDEDMTVYDLGAVDGSSGRLVVDLSSLIPAGKDFSCQLKCSGSQGQALDFTCVMMTDTAAP